MPKHATHTAPANKARFAMAHRSYVTFGPAYIRDVVAGVQSDFDKQISHGVALGLGTRAKLKRLGMPNLRLLLGQTLTAQKELAEQVRNATCYH